MSQTITIVSAVCFFVPSKKGFARVGQPLKKGRAYPKGKQARQKNRLIFMAKSVGLGWTTFGCRARIY
jgi:hypothetical protein